MAFGFAVNLLFGAAVRSQMAVRTIKLIPLAHNSGVTKPGSG